MSECLICYEQFNKSSRKETSCFSCDKKFCRKCIQMYLTSIKEIPTCPECNTEWTLEYISTVTPKSYHNLEYRKHRTSIVLDREKGLLVETQPQVEIIMQERKNAEELEKLRMERFTIVSAPKKDFSKDEIVKKLEEKIQRYNKKLQDRLHELDTIENSRLYIVENRIKELENIMRLGIKKEERKQFIKACPVDGCRGFLSTAWKCGLCETWICKDCHEKKAEKDDESHTCNPDSVETAKLIAAETKPCPTCAIPIYKINGCFSADTQLIMWDGTIKNACDIVVGDQLIGDDGTIRTVEELVQGEDNMYEIVQYTAEKYIVNSQHKLCLKIGDTKDDHNLDITVYEYMKLPDINKERLFGYKSFGVNWPKQTVEIHPYILGMWLGDIKLSDPSQLITLSSYNLVNNKHIPLQYIVNDRKTRLYLLAGIIDAGGYITKKGKNVTIIQENCLLSEDITTLCRSLGFITDITKKNNTLITGYRYEIYLSGDRLEEIPTLLPKKSCVSDDSFIDLLRTPIKVNKVGISKYYGWRVDGNKKFVLKDFTVAHNCDQMYCCAEDTLIWMWDGSKKLAKDVKEGDVLIGEDGNQVIVDCMTRGEDILYEIKQSYGDNYKVIGKHLLTLKDKNDNVVDISAEDFCNLPRYKQKRFFKYACAGIEWPYAKIDLDPYILGIWLGNGISRGDGFISDDIEIIKSWYNWCIINNCEITHVKGNRYNINSVNESKHIPIGYNNMSDCVGCSKKPSLLCASSVELQELIKIATIDERLRYKNLSKLSSGQKALLSTTNEHLIELYNWKMSAEESYKSLDKSAKKSKNIKSNKFIDLLKQYNLIQNKHIPREYLVNDRNTRLKLLSGLIDTDGKVHQKSYIFSKSTRKLSLFNDIVDLSRSLGFNTSITSYHKRETELFPEERESAVLTRHYMMKISGNISEIKVNIHRKKYFEEKSTFIQSTIDVKIADVGKYVGWSVIGKTPRFLLGDGTVTHNCTVCHTAFSWTTGKKETGVIHNPHYYEWQRQQNNGVIARAEGDIVCGGLPDILVLDRHLLDKKVGCTVISQKVVNDRHRIVNHILHVDIPNYNVEMGDAFQQLRIRYLLQIITEQEWVSYIQRNEKKNEKNHAVVQVLRMFTTIMSDMFNNILTKDYDDIIVVWEDMEKLRKYTNDNLLKIYIRFNNVTPYITKNWESVSITSKDKDRDISPNIWTHIYEIPTAVSNTIRLETDGDNNIIIGTKIIKEGGFCYPNLMAPDFTTENIIEIKYITFRITPSNKKSIKKIKDGKYEIQIFTKVDDNLGVGVTRENRDEFCIGDRVLNNAHKKTGNILSISSDKNMCKVVYDDSRVDNLHKSVLTFSPSYAPNLDAFIVEDIIPFNIFREITDENMYDLNTYTFDVPIVLKPGNIMSIVNKSGALDFTWCGEWTVFDPVKFRYLYAFNYGEKVGDIIHRIQTADQLKPGFHFGININ